MSIPIFVDEDIIKEFLNKKLNLKFENLSIEEIIEITKTAKYKDFAIIYKINFNVNQLISFRKKDEPIFYFSKKIKTNEQ